MNDKKPVAYLDVDDTLLMWNRSKPYEYGIAAPKAKEFVLWLMDHFEVRWLTMWCPSGKMSLDRLEALSQKLDIPIETLKLIENPKSFNITFRGFDKHIGIDFNEIKEGREFVWIEDVLYDTDVYALRTRKLSKWHVPCNVTINPQVIETAWQTIRDRFNIED